jgi:hypothetical protein
MKGALALAMAEIWPALAGMFSVTTGAGTADFIGQDGLPWLWSDDKQDWLPVTQTKYAERYAAMQKKAS